MFKSINGGILPQRATKFSAGFDAIMWAISGKYPYIGQAPSKRAVTEFKQSHYFALHIRSSLRAKGLTSLGTGIIDMDYPDEIKIVIHNPVTRVEHTINHDLRHIGAIDLPSYRINKGDKIGQLILLRHEGWLLPEEYTKDEERFGGFGSTGV